MGRIRVGFAAGACAALTGLGSICFASPNGKPAAGKGAYGVVIAKPLGSSVMHGLAWLAKTQQKNGAWGQGDESQSMGNGMQNLRDIPNVADTCAAALAMIRAGNTPSKGEYSKNIRRAVEFVCGEVEASDTQSLYITKLRGTRVQGKLGQYIDTFMASLLLAEAKNNMGDAKAEKRVADAFHKVADKIERNQNKDGTWEKDGWAPALSQSVASKALNRAAQNGLKVNEKTRQMAESYGRAQFDGKSGGFGAGGSAGVPLYAGASSLSAMQDSENTNLKLEKQARYKLNAPSAKPAERKEAKATIDRIEANRRDLSGARGAIVSKMDDPSFMNGFGSNGGEEFLSYMNIGESLVVKGGPEWDKWDHSMSNNLTRIQNPDGTWTGHHCITGRTFCTAAALMVLTVDRTPRPMAGQIARH